MVRFFNKTQTYHFNYLNILSRKNLLIVSIVQNNKHYNFWTSSSSDIFYEWITPSPSKYSFLAHKSPESWQIKLNMKTTKSWLTGSLRFLDTKQSGKNYLVYFKIIAIELFFCEKPMAFAIFFKSNCLDVLVNGQIKWWQMYKWASN